MPPSRSVIDSWEALGNEGWNWSVLRGYFAKSYTAPPVDKAISGNTASRTNHDLPPGSILPYPTEEVMRRGRLAFAEEWK